MDVLLRSLPGERTQIIREDRRTAPHALQLLVAHRELRQLVHVDVDRVGRELALNVAEQLAAALAVGSAVVPGEQVVVGLAVVAPVVLRVGVAVEVERLDVADDGQVEVALERAAEPDRKSVV